MKSNIKKEEANFKYDYENDIFYVYPVNRDYDSSYQMENFIFDLDANQKISGLEILNASKMFNIPKINLKEYVNASMKLIVKDSFIKIRMTLTSIVRNSKRVDSLSIERIKPSFIEASEMNLAIS